MVFGGTGFFAGSVIELATGRDWPFLEQWYAIDEYSMTYFSEGKLFYVGNALGASLRSADCDKF